MIKKFLEVISDNEKHLIDLSRVYAIQPDGYGSKLLIENVWFTTESSYQEIYQALIQDNLIIGA